MYLKLSNVDQPIFDGINVTFERKVQDIWSLKEGQEISERICGVLNASEKANKFFPDFLTQPLKWVESIFFSRFAN